MQRFKKILCVIDHGEASKPALERAVALAENNQAELTVVDVDEGYTPEELNTHHRMNVQILEMASSLAISESAELHVVHAWDSTIESISAFMLSSDMSSERLAADIEQERRQQQQLLDELLRRISTESGSTRGALDYLKPRTHLLKGAPRKEIPALFKRLGVDCIAMGTVARMGIRGFIMGNTAETILAQIDCLVLAIKPPGFVPSVAPAE
jgi:nucleotide-binding universal stress UspA family protein